MNDLYWQPRTMRSHASIRLAEAMTVMARMGLRMELRGWAVGVRVSCGAAGL